MPHYVNKHDDFHPRSLLFGGEDASFEVTSDLTAKMDGDMQGVLPAPTIASSVPPELAMQQPTPVNLATVPNAASLPTAPSTQPLEVTETLYIQNLNERIKINGGLAYYQIISISKLTLSRSNEANAESAVSELWRSARRRCTCESTHARASFCFLPKC